MADPVKYTVTFDFSGFQASSPDDPLPGASVDVEFANVAASIDELVEAVKQIRRSDGVLQNEIVTLDSLSDEVENALLGSSAYDVAVENGFVGTEEEWLASLEGDPATISIGAVTTGDPGTSASVVNVGTSAAAVLNFTIPRGNAGATGAGSGDMLEATYDPQAIGGDAFDVDNHTSGSTNKVFTITEQLKLADIEAGATANSTDATLLARSNHTGSQAISTITDLQTTLDAKQPLATSLTTVAGITLGATGTALLDDTTAAAGRTTLAAAAQAQTFCISGVVVAPVSGDLRLVVNIPFAGSIVNTTTRSAAGTCTATFKINTTALGGSTNSVSTTEQTRAHSTANAFIVGDDIVVSFSSLSSPTYVSFTIEYTRTLA